ncbi:MAG: hypothetical protein AAGA75_27930, partial [Cyanobacteria bacterium P01_E01_bin.6]
GVCSTSSSDRLAACLASFWKQSSLLELSQANNSHSLQAAIRSTYSTDVENQQLLSEARGWECS